MSDLRDILVAHERPNDRLPAFDISEPPRKRPRVNQACETCRERKTRCDGQQPVCRACEKRGVGSSCSYIRQKRPSMTMSDAQPSPLSHQTGSSPHRATEIRSFDGPGFAAINHRSYEVPRKAEDHKSPAARPLSSIDRPSSVTALFRSISDESPKPQESNGAAPRPISQWRPTSYPRYTVASSEPERLQRSHSVPPVLPRRRDADNYIQFFWDYIHPTYPVLHKPTIMRAYDKLWSSEEEEEGQSGFNEDLQMATLNMIFAIGSRFSRIVSDEHKIATADDFYQRSRKTFGYDVLDSASPQMVQLLLLTVMYLQSTHRATRCWNTLGLAIRAAQAIGLHENPTTATSQLQEEMRRRIWHTCVMLDRICAETFARPHTIKRNTLPLPSAIDDEYIQEHGIGAQPSHKKPVIFFFVHSCRIFEELAKVIAQTEEASATVSPEEAKLSTTRKLLDRAVAVNRRMDDLEKIALEEISVERESSVFRATRMHQNILLAKIRNVRLRAGRPLLFSNAEHDVIGAQSDHSSIDQDMLVLISVQSIHAAQHIITTMYEHLNEGCLLDSWHIINIAIGTLGVLLAALKSPKLGVGEASIDRSWDQAIHVVEHHVKQVNAAEIVARILQAMKRHLLTTRTESGESQRSRGAQHNSDYVAAGLSSHLPTASATDSAVSASSPVNGHGFMPDLLDLCAGDTLAEASLSQHFTKLKWLDFPR